MAIALEALRGALAGGAAKGPNAVGQAAVAGAAAGQQQVEQQRKQQEDTDARAQRDLQNRWSTMDNNMKVRQTALVLGRMDRENHVQAVNDQAPMIATAAERPPIVTKDENGVTQTVAPIGDTHVSETDSADVQKYPASVWSRAVDGVVDRTNPDGSPVYLDYRGKVVPEGTPGSYRATDNTYTMVHKDTQLPLTMQDENGKTVPQEYIKSLLPYAGIIPGVSAQLGSAAAGQTLSYATVAKMIGQKNDIQMLQSELNASFRRLGLDDKSLNNAVIDGLKNGTVSMQDLHNFQRAIIGHGGSMQPWDQLQSMMANPDASIQQSAGRIGKLFNLGSDPDDPRGDNLAVMKENARLEDEKDEAGAKDINKTPADPKAVADLPNIAKSLGLSDAQYAAASKGLPTSGASVKQVADVYKEMQNQANKNTTAQRAAAAQADKHLGEAILTTPDAFGFVPANSSNNPATVKEYNKRLGTYKKNADDLSKTESTYGQFQRVLDDINSGKPLSGAASVVSLFNAIGISAQSLKGQGFRINSNVIQEHEDARGLDQRVYQFFANLKTGQTITEQQLKDYAGIAVGARKDAYVNLINQAHNAGLGADWAAPTGNGQKIDQNTAQIFLKATGGDKVKAAAAIKAKGWSL